MSDTRQLQGDQKANLSRASPTCARMVCSCSSSEPPPNLGHDVHPHPPPFPSHCAPHEDGLDSHSPARCLRQASFVFQGSPSREGGVPRPMLLRPVPAWHTPEHPLPATPPSLLDPL